MDQQKEFNNSHPEGCRCMMCHGKGMMCGNGMKPGCHRGRFCFLRFILILIIVCFVFSAGVKVGEFKSELRSGYYGHNSFSRNMMRSNNNSYYGPQMMNGYWQQSTTTTSK